MAESSGKLASIIVNRIEEIKIAPTQPCRPSIFRNFASAQKALPLFASETIKRYDTLLSA